MKKRKKLTRNGTQEEFTHALFLLLMIHFPDLPPDQEPRCAVCRDKINQDCPGKNLYGEECVICMKEKITSGNVLVSYMT